MRLRSLHIEEKPSIMIVPMIDIIFFLLVFFMLSMLTMVSQKTIALQLPAATVAKVDTTKTLPVSVDKNGAIYFEREKISLPDLQSRLINAKEKSEKITVVLRGDVDSSYGDVVTVMDAIRHAGIDRISIATESQ